MRSFLRRSVLEKDNAAAKLWADAILDALGGQTAFERVGLRRLSGMIVLVYARTGLLPHCGEVSSAAVACGVMGIGALKPQPEMSIFVGAYLGLT